MPIRMDIACDKCFSIMELGDDSYCKACYELSVGDKSVVIEDWKTVNGQLKTKDIIIRELREELQKLKGGKK